MQPIDLLVETQFHRAAPGGMGSTKCAGNYSPVLLTQLEAKKHGFADVVYLDAQTNTCLEEVSSCNIFSVKGDVISTPPLKGTILPGAAPPMYTSRSFGLPALALFTHDGKGRHGCERHLQLVLCA